MSVTGYTKTGADAAIAAAIATDAAASAKKDLSNVDPATGRTALGLGDAATHAAADFDATGAANTALTSAKAYTDTEVALRAKTVEGVAPDVNGNVDISSVLNAGWVAVASQSLTAAQKKQAAANIAAWPLQQAGDSAVGPAQLTILNMGGPGAPNQFPNDMILIGGTTGNPQTGRIPIGIIRGNDPVGGGVTGGSLMSFGQQRNDGTGVYYSWQIGLDYATNDWCTFSNLAGNTGDAMRISPGGRFVLGTQIGSPDAGDIQGQVNIKYEKTVNTSTAYGLVVQPDTGTLAGIIPAMFETYDATNPNIFLTSAQSRGQAIQFKGDYILGTDHAHANVKDFYLYNTPSSYYDLILDNLDNWNFGGMTPPTGLTRGFTFKDGVAASSAPVGGCSMVSIGGVPQFRTSSNTIIKLLQGTVSGSRGGNAALASLLTVLAATGLIVDTTTA